MAEREEREFDTKLFAQHRIHGSLPKLRYSKLEQPGGFCQLEGDAPDSGVYARRRKTA